MKIERNLLETLKRELNDSNKIIILYGACQTGKTTLSNEVLSGIKEKILKLYADEIKYIDILSSRNFQKMELLVGDYAMLFIDEAQ